MTKKIAKIAGISIALILALLVTLPWLFGDKIAEMIRVKVNENINATLTFSNASLQFFSSFPDMSIGLEGATMTTNAPFANDTLFTAQQMNLTLPIKTIFANTEDELAIKAFELIAPKVNIVVNEQGIANYDIQKVDEAPKEAERTTSSSAISFAINSYVLQDAEITYQDLESKMSFKLENFQHEGSGDLTLQSSKLKTTSTGIISFSMGGSRYLNTVPVALNAVLDIDLKNSKYTFLENEALVNALPLTFNGFVQLFDDYNEVDITFASSGSSFDNFIAILPAEYHQYTKDVNTTGSFSLSGKVAGKLDDIHVPTFSIVANAENAAVQYAGLPKKIADIYGDVRVENTTGLLDDTEVKIPSLGFKIDEDQFKANANITELFGNPKVLMAVSAHMNLEKLALALPVSKEIALQGRLDADINTQFDVQSIQRKEFLKTKTAGSMKLTNFNYASAEVAKPIEIMEAALTFTPATASLTSFKAKTGASDIEANGTIHNILGFAFLDEKLEGVFNLVSKQLVVNDFMSLTANDEPLDGGSPKKIDTLSAELKVPSFLDIVVNAKADKVLYDGVELRNVSGFLKIKEEQIELSQVKLNLFGGAVNFDGVVSTQENPPSFTMQLGLDKLKVEETFEQLAMFKALAPIAKIISGEMDSGIKLSGRLKSSLAPDLNTLTGILSASLLDAKVRENPGKLLSLVGSQLNFIDPKKIALSGLKTALSFENGKVTVKPFTISYKDVDINISGSHGFDKRMTYSAVFDVPAKYLGSEVNTVLNQLKDPALEVLTVPVTATIGGSFDAPTVATDFSSGVKQMTAQLLAYQKEQLLAKGKAKATDVLTGILAKSTKDTLAGKETTSAKVTQVLGGLLGAKKDTASTTKDTVSNKKDAVKDAATSAIKGLFNRKKKKDTIQKR